MSVRRRVLRVTGLLMSLSCSTPQPTPITFPPFFAQPAVSLGAAGTVYELDGDTLRALTVATRDLLPPQDTTVSCGSRWESQQYRVVRQGDVIFIRIDEDPRACGRTQPALDSGASYAIHRDGRILRRLIDGQPDASAHADAGVPSTLGEPGATSLDALGDGPSPFLPLSWQDAGTPGPAPSR
ncbi:hypothetical protein [Corallococcus exercitus]|uniref:hypothetical protein n=1 Tax=Corallococcus exercitus TaxID=2316736 RepID=UPI0035D42970